MAQQFTIEILSGLATVKASEYVNRTKASDLATLPFGRGLSGIGTLQDGQRLACMVGRSNPYVILTWGDDVYDLEECRNEISRSDIGSKRATSADSWHTRTNAKRRESIRSAILTTLSDSVDTPENGETPKGLQTRTYSYNQVWQMYGEMTAKALEDMRAEQITNERRNLLRTNTYRLDDTFRDRLRDGVISLVDLVQRFDPSYVIHLQDRSILNAAPCASASMIGDNDIRDLLDDWFGESTTTGYAIRDYAMLVGAKVIRNGTWVGRTKGLSQGQITYISRMMADDMLGELVYATAEILSKYIRFAESRPVDALVWETPLISPKLICKVAVRRAAQRIRAFYKNADSTGVSEGVADWAKLDKSARQAFASTASRYGETDPAKIAEYKEEEEIVTKNIRNLTDREYLDILEIMAHPINRPMIGKGADLRNRRIDKAMAKLATA